MQETRFFALSNVKELNRKKCQEKCIRQSVPIVVRNAKFRSNQTAVDQFTAGNVILSEDLQEDIRLID